MPMYTSTNCVLRVLAVCLHSRQLLVGGSNGSGPAGAPVCQFACRVCPPAVGIVPCIHRQQCAASTQTAPAVCTVVVFGGGWEVGMRLPNKLTLTRRGCVACWGMCTTVWFTKHAGVVMQHKVPPAVCTKTLFLPCCVAVSHPQLLVWCGGVLAVPPAVLVSVVMVWQCIAMHALGVLGTRDVGAGCGRGLVQGNARAMHLALHSEVEPQCM